MMRHGRTLVISLGVAALLVGTSALGQGRFAAGALGRGGPGPHAAAFGRPLSPVGHPAALLTRLPIGTSATFTTFDGDPAADAALLQTLSITIGETSEAAFGRELAAALVDGAFLRIDIGETERTLEFDEDTAFAPRGHGAFGTGIGTGMHALGDGDTMHVSFFSDDPETLDTPTETLTFTHGVDSVVGFTRDLHAAAADARFAVIVTSPRTLTFDLNEGSVHRGERGPGARSGTWQDDGAPRMAHRRSLQHDGGQRADPPRTGPRR
jgi:hypothetical protein